MMKSAFFAGSLLFVISACNTNSSNHANEDSYTKDYFIVQAREDTVGYGKTYYIEIFPKQSVKKDVELIDGFTVFNNPLLKKGDILYEEFYPTCFQDVSGTSVNVRGSILERETSYIVLYKKSGDTLKVTIPVKYWVDCNPPGIKQ